VLRELLLGERWFDPVFKGEKTRTATIVLAARRRTTWTTSSARWTTV
jgi:acyl dehydratase